MSPESEFTLGPSRSAGIVRVRGYVPQLPGAPLGGGRLRANLGGREFDLPATTGAFDWLLPVSANTDATHLTLRFTSTAPLPEDDARPAGGKLELIEILPALPTHTFDYGIPGRARLPSHGIDQDGWLARQATIVLPSGGPRMLELKVEYPDWSGKASGHLTLGLSADGSRQVETLTPGLYASIRMPVAASDRPQTLTLTADDDFPLPAPDQRRRAARLVRVELQPATP